MGVEGLDQVESIITLPYLYLGRFMALNLIIGGYFDVC